MIGIAGEFLVDLKINGVTYPLGEGRLGGLKLYETASQMAPMAELALHDRLNFLVELTPMSGTELVEIGIGDNKDNIVYDSFRVFKTRALREGSDSHAVKVYLVSEQSRGLFVPGRYESYVGKKISTMVQEIADDVGLEWDATSIEETTEEYTLFCPGWTYAQMLTYLASQARSKKYGTVGYMYFVDLDDKLHFFSPDYARNQNPIINIVRKNLSNPDQYQEKDVDEGPYRIYENTMLLGGQGAYGVTAAYFDFPNAQFVESPQTIDGERGVAASSVASGFTHYSLDSTLAATKLQSEVDRVAVRSKDEDPLSVVVDYGIAINAATGDLDTKLIKAAREAKILRAANGLVKMDVLIKGDLRVGAGDVVTVQIGSPWPENVTNQSFSGAWVVERVAHQLVPDYVTKLMLFRCGLSGVADNVADEYALVEPPVKLVRRT